MIKVIVANSFSCQPFFNNERQSRDDEVRLGILGTSSDEEPILQVNKVVLRLTELLLASPFLGRILLFNCESRWSSVSFFFNGNYVIVLERVGVSKGV
jgi:hypothetical protein